MSRMFGKSDQGTAGCHPSMASNAPGNRGQLMACCVRAAGLAYGNPGRKPSKTKLQLKMYTPMYSMAFYLTMTQQVPMVDDDPASEPVLWVLILFYIAFRKI